MSRVLEILGRYTSAKNVLFEMFDENGWEAIENQTERRWTLSEYGDLSWLDDEGVEYGFDSATKCGKTIDGIELYYVQDNGEKYYAMFSENLRLSYEDFDKQNEVEL